MRIAEVQIDLSTLPKQDKEWKFALAAGGISQGWIVSIRAEDGCVGYGYASTMAHIGAPHESVKVNLDRLKKHLIGRDPRQSYRRTRPSRCRTRSMRAAGGGTDANPCRSGAGWY